MRTTLDLSDSLYRDAKKLAVTRGLSFKALVELGLRSLLSRRPRSEKFQLKRVSFNGRGLQNGFSETDWNEIRKRAYQGRGE